VPAPSPIPDNIRRFRDDMERECAHLGRQSSEITIVAVSKTMPVEAIRTAHDCGLVHFGENRVQEAKEKIPQTGIIPAPTWHLIGHLQSNKAKDAVELFDIIQSVDSWHLADELNRRALAVGKRLDVLIQVNTSGEEQKSGCDPWDVDELIGDVLALANLRILGLMTIGPLTDDEEEIAPAFQELHSIFERLKSSDLHGGEMRHCSMGMSDDWNNALAGGANMLRVGRVIFGERK
jgi:pyridoxal phosphate enzyme (YggS family)